MPGPVGKRSDQKHGHRTAEELAVTKSPAGGEVRWTAPDEEWHPIAKNWYLQLADSGQSVFYENSDVAAAYYVAEAMSRNLKDAKFSAMLFASIMSAMGDLLVTEGARRRVKVELQRESEESGPSDVDDAIRELTSQFGGGS